MKRPFSHRVDRSGRASNFRWILGGTVVVIALLAIIRFALPGVFIAMAAPLWGSGWSLSAAVGTTAAGFGSKEKLSEENTALAAQVETLTNENVALTTRAQDLTKLLGGNVSSDASGGAGTNGSGNSDEILAGVLARPPESPYDTLVVGMGSTDGVVQHAEVFGQGGIPLGTVSQVNAHSAVISLFSTGGRSTDGWIGTSRQPVTLIGSGGGTFTATIQRTDAIAAGDGVYVPGPGALPIGTVMRINSNPSSPTVVLQIKPLVNLFTLTWVEISRTAS